MKNMQYVMISVVLCLAGCVSTRSDNASVCRYNLRMIHAAKCEYCMKFGIKDNGTVNTTGVNNYLPGKKTPVCPDGGVYTYNNAGFDPTCSIHGTITTINQGQADHRQQQRTQPGN